MDKIKKKRETYPRIILRKLEKANRLRIMELITTLQSRRFFDTRDSLISELISYTFTLLNRVEELEAELKKAQKEEVVV